MAANNVQTAQAPARQNQGASVPFPIASRVGLRPSFSTSIVTLSASAPTPNSPIQVPAVGYIKRLWLEVTLTGTAGTAPAFTADGPFNVIQSIGYRTAAGNDIYVPLDGYSLMLTNKYFGNDFVSDPRGGKQYAAIGGVGPSAHFYLTLDFEFDAETGLGSIPALASNRSYQFNVTFAPIATVLTGTPSPVTVQINAHAEFWHEPPAVSASGLAQQTSPQGLGTLSQTQVDLQSVTAGDKLIKLNNVGAIQRTVIFVLRNGSGVRTEASAWPALCQILLDNNILYDLPQNLWEEHMRRWFGLNATTKDVVGGLDTGVFVLPFHAMNGSQSGDPANSRAQLLPTMDSSQLQLRGSSFGANASQLQIITNNIVPAPGTTVFDK